MININNFIYAKDPNGTVLTEATDLDNALDVALLSNKCCNNIFSPFHYFEQFTTPFGTDERQCQHDDILKSIWWKNPYVKIPIE